MSRGGTSRAGLRTGRLGTALAEYDARFADRLAVVDTTSFKVTAFRKP